MSKNVERKISDSNKFVWNLGKSKVKK